MAYFKNFPVTKYRFGDDDQSEVYYQNASIYSDIVDQMVDQVSAYTKYTILDDERPDTLSYRLYGSVNFYWTFFLLNPELRESGWPLPVTRAYEYVRELYPNWTFTIEQVSIGGQNDLLAKSFPIGQTVTLTGTGPDVTANVISRNLDLGQIVLEPILEGALTRELFDTYVAGTNSLNFTDDGVVHLVDSADIVSKVLQYNSIHHYEDASGEYVDIDPTDINTSAVNLTAVTYQERFIEKNDDVKSIKIFKKDVIDQISGQFHKSVSK